MRHIGIFSGSFDPVHVGHISFAKEAMQVCKLDEVVFMPERFPRGKPNISPISERITELEIALAETPFKIFDAHTDQFTVDETLAELETLYPATKFTFLIGSDVAQNLPKWKHIERLTSRYDFAIGMRTGDTEESLKKALSDVTGTFRFVEAPHRHVSSSQLRQSV